MIKPLKLRSPSGSSIRTPLSGIWPWTLNCNVDWERDVYSRISENYKNKCIIKIKTAKGVSMSPIPMLVLKNTRSHDSAISNQIQSQAPPYCE